MKILKIYRDECPDDPRSWDNLGTMICFHRRYNLGDRHNFRNPNEFQEWVKKVGRNNIVMLPLYIYDHGGITMRTVPFNDPWDSGQVGWIYVTKSRLRREYGVRRVTRRVVERAKDALRWEVEEYNTYLRGDVYGFTVYECGPDRWEKVCSCGGFFETNPLENGMIDEVPLEFRDRLKGIRFRDGLVITESGETFTPGNVDELVKTLFSNSAEKYFIVQELAS